MGIAIAAVGVVVPGVSGRTNLMSHAMTGDWILWEARWFEVLSTYNLRLPWDPNRSQNDMSYDLRGGSRLHHTKVAEICLVQNA
jgi:hypothetical protein